MKEINYTRGYVQVDLDAIEYNINESCNNISEDSKIMLVVKADGYGHGANVIATTFESSDRIWGFGVATLDEGVLLRAAGVRKPILILGCVFPSQYTEAISNDFIVNVYNEDMATGLSQVASSLEKSAKVHIKLDTGMSRLGFSCQDEDIESVDRIIKLENLQVEGVFTHFAKADEVDKTFTNNQFKKFIRFIDAIESREFRFKVKHCSNSAGIIDHPECNMNIVRLGISLYGLYPSDDVNKNNVSLKPALSFYSTIASVKTIPSDTQISYGGTFTSEKDMRIAMVPIGYADGYPRGLSNCGYVLVNGCKAPILGRICMDQMIIDVTEIPSVEFMNRVTLIGSSEDLQISVEELGELANKFNYEFVCGISKRIPRVYIKNGELIDQIDYFA